MTALGALGLLGVLGRSTLLGRSLGDGLGVGHVAGGGGDNGLGAVGLGALLLHHLFLELVDVLRRLGGVALGSSNSHGGEREDGEGLDLHCWLVRGRWWWWWWLIVYYERIEASYILSEVMLGFPEHL